MDESGWFATPLMGRYWGGRWGGMGWDGLWKGDGMVGWLVGDGLGWGGKG